MKPWITLAEADTPDGGKLTLQRRDDELVVRVGGQVLMSSRAHESERALAEVAVAHLSRTSKAAPHVLVGGLGLGFTLRALLPSLPAQARVTVAELSPAIVEWNRRFVVGDALSDPRVSVEIGDVAVLLRRRSAFDAILLDVDNGPSALTQRANSALYSDAALARAHAALAEGGVYVVWSAGPDERFARRMRTARFEVETRVVSSRGSRHVLFVGKRIG